MTTERNLRLLVAALAAAAVLAGCGGGGGTEPPRASISRVVVAGDSLADAGTFGYRFTVQNSADLATGYPVFSQIVAQNFGIAGNCNYYVATSATTFTTNPQAGCTNYAIGNGRIQNTAAQGGATGQQSIPLQLSAAATVAGGAWTGNDLILVDGGGNDAGDLIASYLGAATGPAGANAYALFLMNLVDATTVSTLLGQGATGAAQAAGLYMQKLADKYYDSIRASTLDKGATHVAVVNMPDITVTPSFAAVKTQVAAGAGGGATGAAAAANLEVAVRQWLGAFNTQLSARIGGDGRVALVDAFADIRDQATNPGAYGLTNVTQAACLTALSVSAGSSCTSAALDAAPPTGLTAGWWQTWAFADGLHPTPFGHRLLAASVSRAIARAGWL